MYEDYKMWQKPAVAYNLIYLLRRFLLMSVFFNPFMIDHVLVQIIMLCYIQLFSAMYIFKHKPFIGRLQMSTELFNEITILVSTEALLLYTDIISPDAQN